LLVCLASAVVRHALGPEVSHINDMEGFLASILSRGLVTDAESPGAVAPGAAVVITLWTIRFKNSVLYCVVMVWVDTSPPDGEGDPKSFFDA